MKAIVTVLALAGIGGGAWVTDGFGLLGGGDNASSRARGTQAVRRGDLTITLTERGTLKTKKSTQIRAGVHAKIASLVEEGKSVKKDEVLVELDTKETDQQIEQYANQITQLKAELKSAETELTIQIDQNKTDIEKAELDLQVKTVEEEKLLESEIPTKLRKLKLDIEEKGTGLDRAKDQVAASKQLLEEEFVTPLQHEDALLNLKKAQEALKTAELELANYNKYELPLDKRKKRAAVVEAERGLERQKKRAEAQLAAKEAKVQQKKVSLNRVTQQHEKLVKQREKMTLKAPTAGTVLYGDPDNPWNNDNVKVGQQVWGNMVLITLPDPSEMAVTVEIHEADIDKVEKGMKAFVASETKKGQMFEGEVSKIDAVANANRRWGGDNVKRFRVEVSLHGKDLDLKTGTSAKVEIQIGTLEGVLYVPNQALHAKEGKYFCYRRTDDGRAERVDVEPGAANDVYIEIQSGLDVGDEVLLYDPEESEKTGDDGDDGPAPLPNASDEES